MSTTYAGSTNLGETNIFGNININNESTQINSSNLEIKDNIITINSGEQSNKVSSNIAGIEIDRGTSPSYKILYDENDMQIKIGLNNSLKSVATTEYVDDAIQIAINNIVNGDEVTY